jgi:hypothetical protein
MRVTKVVLCVVIAWASASCKPNPHACTTTDIGNGDPQMWTVAYRGCGDKKSYGVTCVPDPTVPVAGLVHCTCSVDGVSGKEFPFTSSALPSDPVTLQPIVNSQCGWELE